MKTNAKLIVLVFALMCVFSTPVWPQGFVGKASHNVGMAVTKATTHYVATGAYNRQLVKIRQNSDIYRLQGVSVPHNVVMKNSIRRNQETVERLRRLSDQIRKSSVISPTKKSVMSSSVQKMINEALAIPSSSLNADSLKPLPAKTARK